MYYRRRPYRRRRHFFRHRKWNVHRRRWRRAHRRRGYYRRRRVSNIRQLQPRKKRLLVVTGWEILGQLGSQIKYGVGEDKNPVIEVLNPVPINKQVEYLWKLIPQGLENKCTDYWTMNMNDDNKKPWLGPTHWDFCGGWGYAKFDFQSLILRNLLGFNRFSDDIKSFTHIRFLKFKIQLVRGSSVDYLFRLQMHRGPQDWESPLVHPAHLLNMPFVTWVESNKRSKCCRMKVLRRLATTDLSGWYDIESFRALELFSYQWTAFDPNNPLGKNPILPKELGDKKWWNDDWMRVRAGREKGPENAKIIKDNRRLDWMERTTYDNNFVGSIDPKNLTQTQNFWDWLFDPKNIKKQGKSSPFLPPILPSEYVNTLWFRYKIYFQIGGQTISRLAPPWPLRETYDNTSGKCLIRDCPDCIREGDLDDTGQLKEAALERITESPKRRKARLVAKLAEALQQRRKRKRRHITWWDEKEEVDPSPPDPHPQVFKNKRIRSLASCLGLRLVGE
uniref:Capsid protein n=1 Tax=Giant panda anellovirus TaxID=2016460 RepID=A0A220IGK1_9VIRU|nr:ORF1 [Giant panda anellovirus]